MEPRLGRAARTRVQRAKRRKRLKAAALYTLIGALLTIAVRLSLPGQRRDSATAIATVSAPPQTAPSPQKTPNPTLETTATATPSPSPSPTPRPTLRAAVIRSVGDLVIHKAIYESARVGKDAFDFRPMFEWVEPILSGASYTVANVEGSLGGMHKEGYLAYPRFNTPPDLIPSLKDSGVDMLTLSNNHALDMYFDGVKRTIENCEQYGMAFVGAARTQAERDTPVIVDIEDIQVGFLNYTTGTNAMERHAHEDAQRFGIAYVKNARFDRDVAALKAGGADVVLAYLHWGNEYERKASSSQRRIARQLTAAGVDVIIGTHPHVVQPIDWVVEKASDGQPRRALCAYSLGNFLSNQPQRYRDAGIIFEFTIQEVSPGRFEIQSPKYIPTYYWTRGSEKAKTDFIIRVVPVGQYRETRPEGMDDKRYERLLQVWDETRKLLGEKVAAPSAG